MPSSNDILLSLIRLGIGHRADAMPDSIKWQQIKALADMHGLLAFVVDGIEQLPENKRPPKVTLLEWIGEVLQNYELRYKAYQQVIAEMAGFYNKHCFKMMVLKGYACSLDWPKPNHRPCGDIDIWQFGECKKADAVISAEKGIKIDNSHHHHTVFYWSGFMVENHYDFINIHRYKSNKQYEVLLKELGKDDSHKVSLFGETVYVPSPNLHALFLLRHSMMDFVSSNLSLRQVLDWAFFVEKHTTKIDWGWINGVLREFNMVEFYNILNAICVDDLGFATEIFHTVQFSPSLKERVLKDILNPEYQRQEPKSFLPRLIYKHKRWKGNSWKQELCFKESRWENFLRGITTKVTKPSIS